MKFKSIQNMLLLFFDGEFSKGKKFLAVSKVKLCLTKSLQNALLFSVFKNDSTLLLAFNHKSKCMEFDSYKEIFLDILHSIDELKTISSVQSYVPYEIIASELKAQNTEAMQDKWYHKNCIYSESAKAEFEIKVDNPALKKKFEEIQKYILKNKDNAI